MMSFYYNMEQIIGKQRLNILKESNTIQVIPMAYMRGITLSNKFVILDEAQNATPEQIKMFVTRIGENSKYIITGDLDQSDISKHKSGLEDAIKRFAGVHGVGLGSVKEMNENDTVEVQPDFELIAFDFVSNPSTHGAFLSPTNEGKLNEGVGTRDGVCCHDCKIENIINDIFRGE